MELSAEEQDASLIILEVAKASGGGFDEVFARLASRHDGIIADSIETVVGCGGMDGKEKHSNQLATSLDSLTGSAV